MNEEWGRRNENILVGVYIYIKLWTGGQHMEKENDMGLLFTNLFAIR